MALRPPAALVLLLALTAACAAPPRLLLDTGQSPPREYRPAAASEPVKVSEAAFEQALSRLMLDSALALRTPQQDWLVRTSFLGSPQAPRWQDLVSKSFGGLCTPGQPRHTCISVLDDLMGLSEWDKLGIALGLSFEPLRESIARAVQDTLAPQLFYSVISVGLVSWVMLAANPEPVFTKAAAVVSAVMLIYLSTDVFLDVLKASQELRLAATQATTFEELEQASQRFANRVGPQVSRVFVLAASVVLTQGMVGGAAWLASRLPLLPGFPVAAAAGAAGMGVKLSRVDQVSAVAVAANGTITLTLAPTAVAMTALGPGESQTGSEPTGQEHHVISKRIARKLEEHATLRGRYAERDPRFKMRAANKESHNGYQKWHRDVDEEVIKWLESTKQATPAEFEAFLRSIYSRPDMRARFPHGF
jgi:hypothetical protein